MTVLSSNLSTVGSSDATTPLTQALPSLYLIRVPTPNSPFDLPLPFAGFGAACDGYGFSVPDLGAPGFSPAANDFSPGLAAGRLLRAPAKSCKMCQFSRRSCLA